MKLQEKNEIIREIMIFLVRSGSAIPDKFSETRDTFLKYSQLCALMLPNRMRLSREEIDAIYKPLTALEG